MKALRGLDKMETHSSSSPVHSGILWYNQVYSGTLRYTQIYSDILNEGSKGLRKV